MKIVQIPQPFATLVCAGIADVAFSKYDIFGERNIKNAFMATFCI